MPQDSIPNRLFGLKCPDCKKPIAEEDIYCPYCGVNLDEPIAQEAEVNEAFELICSACKQPVSDNDLFCPHCGEKMDEAIEQEVKLMEPAQSTELKTLIGGNQALNDYVLTADGLGRMGLNIMCFIGVFIFGWLLTMAFQSLGKKNLGWYYIGPVFVCLAISRFGGDLAQLAGMVALILYAVGWIHANLVLSEYQSGANKRIAQIEGLSTGNKTTDILLEKGILQSKVLGQKELAFATFAKAAQMPGGNAKLLNMAGVALFASKRYAQAKPFFERALSGTKDDGLIKQIKQNQASVEKKLK
jgi:DNA-directed RNA polymerase subunit RPC12/RpoP